MDKILKISPDNLRLKRADDSLTTDIAVNPETNQVVFCPRGLRLSPDELTVLLGMTTEDQLARGVAVLLPGIDPVSLPVGDIDPDDPLPSQHQWAFTNKNICIMASDTGSGTLRMTAFEKALQSTDTEFQFYPEQYFKEYIEP